MSMHNIACRSILSPALVAVAVFFIFLNLLFPGSSRADIQKSIHIEWSYDTSVSGLAGYRIYQDGNLVQEIDNPLQSSTDLVAFFTSATSSFAMTAFDSAGNESAPSQPYVITLDPSITSLTASITADTLSGNSPLTVHFDGSHSSGGLSTIVAWKWDFGDGSTGSGAVVDHLFSNAGIYPVTLTVTDANNNTAVAHTTITVTLATSPGNLSPIADISVDHTSGTAPFTVQFDASSSHDNDGTIVSYNWDFGDGASQSGKTVSHTFAGAGSFTATLTVTDDKGAVGHASVTITVAAANNTANQPPLATIAASSTTGVAPLTAILDGSGSSDADGNIVGYAWNFGDGSTGTGSVSQHVFATPGTYSVQLTVTDNLGSTGTSSVKIVVQDSSAVKTYTGGVTVNGTAISGVQVQVLDSSQNVVGTFPVENGTFTTDPLPIDSYTFRAVYGKEQTEVFADQTNDWQLSLHSLSGSVTGIGGDGSGSVAVIAYSPTAKLMAGVKVQDLNNTSYTINNLLPADDYVVSAAALDKPILYYAGALSQSNATPVNLTNANAGNVNFDFSNNVATTVSGSVLLNGVLAGAVPVYAYEVNTSALQLTLAGSNGAYSLSLADGEYILFAVVNGRTYYFTENGVNQNLSQSSLVTVSGGAAVSNLDFSVVTCGHKLSGTVSDAANARAVAGAMVTARGSSNVASAYTDSAGHYVIDGICADTYTVYMDSRLDNYPIQTQKVNIAASDASGIDFVINNGHTLSGVVSSSVDSQPLAGTQLYLDNELTGQMFGLRSFTTDQQGKYVIHDIPTGDYSLHLNSANFKSKVVAGLHISDNLVENVSLSEGGYVWGYVQNEAGQAISGRLVQVQGSNMQPAYGKTDASGRFTIGGLPLNTPLQMLVSRGANQGYQISGSAVFAKTGGTRVDLTVNTVTQTFTLSGTVRSECGQTPLANVQVVAYHDDATTKFFKVGWTDADGNYLLRDLPAAANYQLAVIVGAGRQPAVIDGIDGTQSAVVVQDVAIACGQSIAGVVAINNVSAPAYAVLFDSNHAFVDSVALQNTGQSGSYSFSFDNLPDGEYKLVLTANGETPVWYANASTFETATTLQPGGAIINMAFGQ